MLSNPISADADYFKQYANLYFCRLNQAKKDLSHFKALAKVSDIVKHDNEKVQVVGTVFQDKKVHDYSKVEELEFLDVYYLEDEYSRIPLSRNGFVLISGSVVGMKGTVIDEVLVIDEIVYPYSTKNAVLKQVECEKPWLLLCSGLELQVGGNSLELSALFHLLCGNNNGFPKDILEQLQTVAFVGNNFNKLSQTSLNEMDSFIGEISKYHNVLLVPSNSDPGTVSWPNQPMPLQLFPKATSSVTSVENPARFESNGIEIIFESGDALNNIHEILNKNGATINKDDVVELLVKCRHLAPNCPDTLPCIPSFNEDPLYLTNIPDVLFIGNQEEAGLRQVGSCTIISIPSFTRTGKVLLYNLTERRYKVITINKQF